MRFLLFHRTEFGCGWHELQGPLVPGGKAGSFSLGPGDCGVARGRTSNAGGDDLVQ
jgi:hypothetical protein